MRLGGEGRRVPQGAVHRSVRTSRCHDEGKEATAVGQVEAGAGAVQGCQRLQEAGASYVVDREAAGAWVRAVGVGSALQ